MSEPKPNQLWRSLSPTEPWLLGDAWCRQIEMWQRPVPACNCAALLREALDVIRTRAKPWLVNLDMPDMHVIHNTADSALAAPCTSDKTVECSKCSTAEGEDGMRIIQVCNSCWNELLADRDKWKDRRSLGWIALSGPGSRKPTAEDADEKGQVLCRWSDGVFRGERFDIKDWGRIIAWMPLPKFTAVPDPDEAAFEENMAEELKHYHRDAHEWSIAEFAWQAALAHRDQKDETLR